MNKQKEIIHTRDMRSTRSRADEIPYCERSAGEDAPRY